LHRDAFNLSGISVVKSRELAKLEGWVLRVSKRTDGRYFSSRLNSCKVMVGIIEISMVAGGFIKDEASDA
jgi:hypothetical protein